MEIMMEDLLYYRYADSCLSSDYPVWAESFPFQEEPSLHSSRISVVRFFYSLYTVKSTSSTFKVHLSNIKSEGSRVKYYFDKLSFHRQQVDRFRLFAMNEIQNLHILHFLNWAHHRLQVENDCTFKCSIFISYSGVHEFTVVWVLRHFGS